jgi:archaellum component FlaC
MNDKLDEISEYIDYLEREVKDQQKYIDELLEELNTVDSDLGQFGLSLNVNYSLAEVEAIRQAVERILSVTA